MPRQTGSPRVSTMYSIARVSRRKEGKGSKLGRHIHTSWDSAAALGFLFRSGCVVNVSFLYLAMIVAKSRDWWTNS